MIDLSDIEERKVGTTIEIEVKTRLVRDKKNDDVYFAQCDAELTKVGEDRYVLKVKRYRGI